MSPKSSVMAAPLAGPIPSIHLHGHRQSQQRRTEENKEAEGDRGGGDRWRRGGGGGGGCSSLWSVSVRRRTGGVCALPELREAHGQGSVGRDPEEECEVCEAESRPVSVSGMCWAVFGSSSAQTQPSAAG